MLPQQHLTAASNNFPPLKIEHTQITSQHRGFWAAVEKVLVTILSMEHICNTCTALDSIRKNKLILVNTKHY